jgi:signal transduction histidine kinase
MMTDKSLTIADRYTASLREYLVGGGEAALQRAYELGRDALGQGVGLLDMITLHHNALRTVLQIMPIAPQALEKTIAAELFLLESLSPFEMTHRGFRESNALLKRLNQTLEEECKRIAHALHDEAGQLLASVYLALDETARNVPQSRADLQKIKWLLDQIESQLRRLSHELRPAILDDLGLLPALKFLCEGVAARTGLQIDIEGTSEFSLAPLLGTVLYRFVQESLTNVARHAKASWVRIDLQQESQSIRCTITDNGIGFDVPVTLNGTEKSGLGLIGMQERVNSLGGSLAIHSNPGRGTELTVTIPSSNPPGAFDGM